MGIYTRSTSELKLAQAYTEDFVTGLDIGMALAGEADHSGLDPDRDPAHELYGRAFSDERFLKAEAPRLLGRRAMNLYAMQAGVEAGIEHALSRDSAPEVTAA